MLRRSMSLCEPNTDLNRFKRGDQKVEGQKPCFIRHMSFQMLKSPGGGGQGCGIQPSYGLPTEDDISPMLRSAVGFSLTRYLQIVALPVAFILTCAYLFTYVPALPHTETYRSLSVVFVLLMGITLQGCFVTAWAARTLGFGDFLLLLRNAIGGYL